MSYSSVLARLAPTFLFMECYSDLGPVDWHNALQRIQSLDDSSTGSSAATAMAQTWLHFCLENHPQCSLSLSHSYSPTRVLDIGLYQGVDNVKIIQNVILKEPYVALSHL